jgi:trehalose 6-phosphate phosphatase
MTQQNVIVPETKSAINRPVAGPHKPPAVPGGFIPIPRRRVLKNLEINGGQRINAWIDSMRASSPTHAKSTPALPEQHNSWIVRISSLLCEWDLIFLL